MSISNLAMRLRRPVVVLVGALVMIAAMSVSSVPSVDALPAGSRIAWESRDWYLNGANMPWINWACDFGCADKGVASAATNATVDGILAQAQANDVKVVRWWVFEGDAWQITRDAGGAPATLTDAVYADFDAALKLAEAHDVYYIFTLFSAPSHLPTPWLENATARGKLAEALVPLFARYKDNPRILAWDIFNEPDWDIWNNRVQKESVQATVRVLADAVHANSKAYVTVAAAMLDGLPHWTGLGLDFYTANWYDYMQPGNWCALCTDYATVRDRYGLDAPLVIGEFYAGADVGPLERYEAWYAKGYTGALAWSLNADATSDKLRIDLPAAASFAKQHSDLGPAARR
jgi:hypothetical protein